MSDLEHRPTRARFGVAAYLCAMAFILYLDRVCIGQAGPPMQHDLGISKTRWGLVLGAFTLAYGLFEVPTGRWGDRFGSRRVLTRIVVWWSAFTCITGACIGLYSLIVVRFLFGAGEAGAYPNAARILARWFPVAERGRVQGIMLGCSLVGAAAAPVFAQFCIDQIGWRWTFVAFGLVGIVWSKLFFAWFRDNPADHSAVNAGELALVQTTASQLPVHEPIPWRQTVRNSNIWLLGGIVVCAAFTTYVFYSWYPKYLQDARRVSASESAWMNTVVLSCGAVAMLFGGWINDRMTSNRSRLAMWRQRLGSPSYFVAAAALAASTFCDNAWASVLCSTVAYCCVVMMQTIWWSCATEVSGRHIGSLFGLLNAIGIFGAMGSQFFFGWFADWRAELGYFGRDQWDPAFCVCASLLGIGGALWWLVNPANPVVASTIEDSQSESANGAGSRNPR